MEPLERKAHLVLQGQSLLDEWGEHCKAISEARYIIENAKHPGEKREALILSNAINLRAAELWCAAYRKAGLYIAEREWEPDLTYTMSNGEVYRFI